jgi:hypothetical protein
MMRACGGLLFFNTPGKPFSHVALNIGDGRFVHARIIRNGPTDIAHGSGSARQLEAERANYSRAAEVATAAAQKRACTPPLATACQRTRRQVDERKCVTTIR